MINNVSKLEMSPVLLGTKAMSSFPITSQVVSNKDHCGLCKVSLLKGF